MSTLRTTVIMKTDISGSTVKFRGLAEADLHALLIDHREFLSRHALAHHRTRVVEDQYIVFTDLRGFTQLVEGSPMTTVEKLLDALLGLINRVSQEFGGMVRFSTGDSYCVTFEEAGLAMAAAERLSESWDAFLRQEKLTCPINMAVHRGTLYAFRSYLYGAGINLVSRIESASASVLAPDEGSVFVSGEVRRDLAGTMWGTRLDLTDARPRGHPETEIYRLGPAT